MRRPHQRGEPLPSRWTREQLRVLTTSVGSFGLDYTVRNTGRSAPGVYWQIRHQWGGGGIGRGTKSLTQVVKDTGYDRRQLIRAGLALGQRWQRTSRHGRIMLGDDQVEALGLWLRHDYWCGRLHLYACVDCGRRDRPPRALGLCTSCYWVWWRRFRAHGQRLTRAVILRLIQDLRASTPPEAADWLDAFEASMGQGCVLTRGALWRLWCSSGPDQGDSSGRAVRQGWHGEDLALSSG